MQWDGPACCSDEFAVGMGFADSSDLRVRCRQLRHSIMEDQPLGLPDWTRTLLAVEVAFASDIMGTGFEWRTMTGLADDESVKVLRSIQGKLGKYLKGYYGKTPGN